LPGGAARVSNTLSLRNINFREILVAIENSIEGVHIVLTLQQDVYDMALFYYAIDKWIFANFYLATKKVPKSFRFFFRDRYFFYGYIETVFLSSVRSYAIDGSTNGRCDHVHRMFGKSRSGGNMRNKTDILRAASRLFSKQGYYGTSMRELARSLDLQGGSLYSHIKSKEQLLWEIVDGVGDAFMEQAEAVSQLLPLEEQMAQLVRGHLEVIAEELPCVIVFFHEWKFLEPDLRDSVRKKREDYEAYFRRVIEEGTRQELFQVSDTRIATLFVLSILNWTYQWFSAEESLTAGQLANDYLTFIMRALKVKSTLP
jgi:AcrR family transcriptional regulator